MVFWLAFLGLPKEAIALIVAAIVVLVMSAISIVFPDIGLFVFGILFIVAAVMFKTTTLKLKHTEISISAILVIMGVAVILANLLNLKFHLFAVALSTMPKMSIAMATIGDASTPQVDWEYWGITPGIVGAMLTVIVGSAIGAVLSSKYLIRRRK